MGWLWAIIVGLVLGLIAKAVLPGKQNIPLWLTALLGLIGGTLGNAAASGLGVRDTKGIDWTRHLLQLIAAVIIVGIGSAVWNAVRGNGRRPAGRDHEV
ncbi:GlsB/YeaQ/YmgE family stress response membrane protein [Streptomyces sp. NPDC052042]|uniref:GlsB/YeaQ/YmgE family stress response membrane protein n=1 Tax=Streptomyces sp. NPDC052042 TaxID=3365683 RepID=UPI0037D1FF80